MKSPELALWVHSKVPAWLVRLRQRPSSRGLPQHLSKPPTALTLPAPPPTYLSGQLVTLCSTQILCHCLPSVYLKGSLRKAGRPVRFVSCFVPGAENGARTPEALNGEHRQLHRLCPETLLEWAALGASWGR